MENEMKSQEEKKFQICSIKTPKSSIIKRKVSMEKISKDYNFCFLYCSRDKRDQITFIHTKNGKNQLE